ncbi:elongation factor P [Rhodospirillaceae bacterium KN72]|uniref:Elongation factor P n=1 Tax=Pacificispira spongiicola TaxID=2729598 RepID=A0A7Y0DWP2_9PROT|nr:elongation factor P [Pacificispira spongiicola]NMM42960.1 elongation factor P [Pacificispira spongiicola]
MKVNAISLRAGSAFLLDGKLLVVTKNEINQPGKGAAVAQIEARDARTGVKTNLRFRTQEALEAAELFETDYSFLYDDGEKLHFMNQDTYDQIEVEYDVLGDLRPFLQENMIVQIKTYEASPISITLPQKVTLEVVEADPVVKGQTQSSSYKPAKLENGVSVLVPPHIEAGTRIVVNTTDASYVERAKD